MSNNNRSNDDRIVALLQQILISLHDIHTSIQDTGLSPPGPPRTPSPLSPSPSYNAPSSPKFLRSQNIKPVVTASPLPSQATSGEGSAVLSPPSTQARGRPQYTRVPAAQRWYVVFRGRQVGVIQGWYVLALLECCC